MNSAELNHLFVCDIPLLDVRAPVEFQKGAFPNAINAPILDDLQRTQVGICYKQQGQDQAIELGHRLVNGATKQQRVQEWKTFAQTHPHGYLYCYRGGLRSRIAQSWLKEVGVEYPLIPGGYKTMRQYLLNTLEVLPCQFRFILVGGLTGNGKTSLIKSLPAAIDLEGIAHHRGSSFGHHATPQHTQINFENELAIALLKMKAISADTIVLEDEGRCIGSVDIPKTLYYQMRKSPLVIIDEPIEDRVKRLFDEYIINMQLEFSALYGDEKSIEYLSKHLLAGLDRIQKRLGPEQWKHIRELMCHAFDKHRQHQDTLQHYQWLTELLVRYYDPMYHSQLEKKQNLIQFRGNHAECTEYIQSALNS